MLTTENLNIDAFDCMPTPDEIHQRLPVPEDSKAGILQSRQILQDILDRKDDRKFVVVGPCSIHDPIAGIDYARRLAALASEVSDVFCLVMRVYFEKPRTTVGWKGFINDPLMDDSFRIDEGMYRARAFLLAVNQLGLPAATEALDPIAPQYLGDLIAWTAIGARTAESQTHREMASGLSTPVGFKNGTDGSLSAAINAMLSAAQPHSFLGINGQGRSAIIRTRGNRYGHLVLRGGGGQSNHDRDSIANAGAALEKAGLPVNIVVDCSHANCGKNAARQPLVLDDVLQQIAQGNQSVVGLMLESFIAPGNQSPSSDLASLRYGCSVTDPCLDWETTATTLRAAAVRLRSLRAR